MNNGVLTNQQGQPYMIVADAPQAAITLPLCSAGNTLALCTGSSDVLPTNATFVAYVKDRQTQGFNSLWLNTICEGYTACQNNAGTYDNVYPFTAQLTGVTGCPEATPPSDANCWDLTTPNATYWTRIDAMIALAGQYGMQVIANVIPTDSCQTSSWMQTFVNNNTKSPSNITSFGSFLANRYKNTPNIIWLIGNDYACWNVAADDNIVYAFAGTIKSNDPNHVMTSEIYTSITSLGNTTNAWANNVNMNGVGSSPPPYDLTLLARQQNSTSIPPMLVESNYLGEDNSNDDGTTGGTRIAGCGSAQIGSAGSNNGNPNACPLRERHQFWWVLLSGGSAGYLNGNHYTWTFGTGWNSTGSPAGVCNGAPAGALSQCLDTASNANLVNGQNFLKQIAWYKLVPYVQYGGAFSASPYITGCYPNNTCSTYYASGVNAATVTNGFPAGGAASDGSFGIAYIPGVAPTGTPAISTGLQITANNALVNGGSNLTAAWYDPSSAMTSPFSTICSPTTTPCNSGSQTYTTPGSTHTDGYADWVLLVKQASGGTATASLTANPTTITSGASSTLTWSSTNATSCTGTNFSTGTGSPTSGSTSVSPTVTTGYTVTCSGAQANATVAVTSSTAAEEFVGPLGGWVNPTTAGGCSTIGNGSTDATSCLQTAFNNLGGSTPVVWIPSGTYNISAPLTITTKANVAVYCQDPTNTTLVWTPPALTIAASVSGGTTLTVTSGNGSSLAPGDMLFDKTGALGFGTTILSGSGSTWTLDSGGPTTVASETMWVVPPMISMNKTNFSKVNRCKFNGGTAKQGVGVSVWGQNTSLAGGGFPTGNEFADDTFTNLIGGIAAGFWGNAASELSALRDTFTGMTTGSLFTPYNWGFAIATGNFNAADIWLWWSTVANSDYGLTNVFDYRTGGGGAGNFSAWKNNFSNSLVADLAWENTDFFTFVDNYSNGSNQFIHGGGSGNNAAPIVFGNTVVNTTQSISLQMANLGPNVILNNAFVSKAGSAVPVVQNYYGPTDIFSMGNTFNIGSLASPCSSTAPVQALSSGARCHEITTGTYPDTINGSLADPGGQTLPPTPTNTGPAGTNVRQIYEVGRACDAAEGSNCHGSYANIAAAMTAAASSGTAKPVVHIPAGNYSTSASLTVPACSTTAAPSGGCDMQIIGDGTTTLITATSTNAPIVLAGPSKATVRDLEVDGNGHNADGLQITNADQVGAVVFMEQPQFQISNNTNAYSDGINSAVVEIHNSQSNGANTNGFQATGSGQMNIFLGQASLNLNSYVLSGTGNMVVGGVWYDHSCGIGFPTGCQQNTMVTATGSGNFTHFGSFDFLNVTNPNDPCTASTGTNPVINFNNYNGTAAMLGVYVNNADNHYVNIRGTTTGNFLGLGMSGCPANNSYWSDTGSADTSMFLTSNGGGSTFNQPQVAEVCKNTTCSPPSGTTLSTMLGQMMAINPIFPTPSGNGITNVQLYHVQPRNAAVGIHVMH